LDQWLAVGAEAPGGRWLNLGQLLEEFGAKIADDAV
jgi:hypothetical protein